MRRAAARAAGDPGLAEVADAAGVPAADEPEEGEADPDAPPRVLDEPLDEPDGVLTDGT